MELHSAGGEVPINLQVNIPESQPGGALGTVLERSRQLSLTRYEKPLFSESDHLKALETSREPIIFTKAQQEAFAGKSVCHGA